MNIAIEPQTWFPVVTLVVGVALKALVDALTETRAFMRGKETRHEERREAARAAHADFQRTTLLALQEECQKLARSTALIHHEDVMAYRRTSTWQKTTLSEKASDGSRDAFATILKLRVRVADKETRRYTQDYTNACSSVAQAGSESSSDKELKKAMRIQETLYERIGEVLRSLHDEEHQSQ